MLRTGIPASYWHTAPMPEVRTAIDLLVADNQQQPSGSAATVGVPEGDVVVGGRATNPRPGG